MSSTLNPPKIDPKDIPALAPEVVVTRADHDAAKPDPAGRPAASAAPKGAEAAAGVKAPPVDTTFRATSTDPVKGKARTSFGRRLLRGVIGMILTACVAGAAVLWQSHGDVVRRIVTKSVAPVVLALLSRDDNQAVEQPSGSPVVQASVVAGAPVRLPQGNVHLPCDSREQDRALDLCAGDRHLIAQRAEPRAFDGEGQPVAVSLDEPRSHARERPGHPPHRPAAKRAISGKGG